MKSHLDEAHLVDLDDGQLKELLGHTYHAIKDREEEKKNDPQIAQMRDQLRDYIKDNFDDEIKSLKARMKAARALAKARGVHWKLPEDS
jgi:hypothetical protein